MTVNLKWILRSRPRSPTEKEQNVYSSYCQRTHPITEDDRVSNIIMLTTPSRDTTTATPSAYLHWARMAVLTINRWVVALLTALYLDALLQLLALHLAREYVVAGVAPPVPVRGAPPSVHLARALDYIEANLDREVRLADLAAVAGLSLFHFARAFKAQLGVPPHRYVLERRIERARRLLADRRRPVIEVAAACGFASPSHFATAFRRQSGMSPRAYRRQQAP